MWRLDRVGAESDDEAGQYSGLPLAGQADSLGDPTAGYRRVRMDHVGEAQNDAEQRPSRRGFRVRSILILLIVVGAVAALGLTVWRLYTDRQVVTTGDDVPVIRAETADVRVSPTDPGGLEVPHQDRLVLEEVSSDAPVLTDQAPPPEEPMVDALEALASAQPVASVVVEPDQVLDALVAQAIAADTDAGPVVDTVTPDAAAPDVASEEAAAPDVAASELVLPEAPEVASPPPEVAAEDTVTPEVIVAEDVTDEEIPDDSLAEQVLAALSGDISADEFAAAVDEAEAFNAGAETSVNPDVSGGDAGLSDAGADVLAAATDTSTVTADASPAETATDPVEAVAPEVSEVLGTVVEVLIPRDEQEVATEIETAQAEPVETDAAVADSDPPVPSDDVAAEVAVPSEPAMLIGSGWSEQPRFLSLTVALAQPQPDPYIPVPPTPVTDPGPPISTVTLPESAPVIAMSEPVGSAARPVDASAVEDMLSALDATTADDTAVDVAQVEEAAAVPTDIPTPPAPPVADAADDASDEVVTAAIVAIDAPVVSPPPAPAVDTANEAASLYVSRADGTHRVQLVAVTDPADIDPEWSRFQERYPDLLGGVQRYVTQVDLGDRGIWHRVMADGLSRSDANALCQALITRGADCIVRSR